MGDRGNVRLEYGDGNPPIFLYTHWTGTDLPNTVARALQRGVSRWDDPEYLARIIFSEMVRNDIEGTTGFGIAPYHPDQEHPDVVVDLKNRAVNGVTYKSFVERLGLRVPDAHEENLR